MKNIFQSILCRESALRCAFGGCLLRKRHRSGLHRTDGRHLARRRIARHHAEPRHAGCPCLDPLLERRRADLAERPAAAGPRKLCRTDHRAVERRRVCQQARNHTRQGGPFVPVPQRRSERSARTAGVRGQDQMAPLYIRIRSVLGANIDPTYSNVLEVNVQIYRISLVLGTVLDSNWGETSMRLASPEENGIYTGFMASPDGRTGGSARRTTSCGATSARTARPSTPRRTTATGTSGSRNPQDATTRPSIRSKDGGADSTSTI